jgi:hypothetical protein
MGSERGIHAGDTRCSAAEKRTPRRGARAVKRRLKAEGLKAEEKLCGLSRGKVHERTSLSEQSVAFVIPIGVRLKMPETDFSFQPSALQPFHLSGPSHRAPATARACDARCAG